MAPRTVFFALACFMAATVSALPHNGFLLSTNNPQAAQAVGVPASNSLVHLPNVLKQGANPISDSHTSRYIQVQHNVGSDPNYVQIVTNDDRDLAAYLDEHDLDDEFTKRSNQA